VRTGFPLTPSLRGPIAAESKRAAQKAASSGTTDDVLWHPWVVRVCLYWKVVGGHVTAETLYNNIVTSRSL
jgi:hypothetical protein